MVKIIRLSSRRKKVFWPACLFETSAVVEAVSVAVVSAVVLGRRRLVLTTRVPSESVAFLRVRPGVVDFVVVELTLFASLGALLDERSERRKLWSYEKEDENPSLI